MKHRAVPVLLAAAGLVSVPAAAKRTAPPVVPPLEVEGVRYTPAYDRLPGDRSEVFRASILAQSGSSYKVLEKIPVYEIRYKADLERDVQERYIAALTKEVGGLLARTEDGKYYLVDPQAKRTTPLPPAPDQPDVKGPRVVDARGKTERCELHGTKLQDDAVAIVYGLVRFPAGYKEARKKFPTANAQYFAGCILSSPRWALVKYCPNCREQQHIWQKQQAGDKV